MTPASLKPGGVALLAFVHQAKTIPEHGAWTMPKATTCPECQQGDVISISMSVSGRDLSFSTCHACEAKWWHRDGEQIVLSDVIETVVQT
jgi:DNA polymerase III alpha subunit (gram-positive type)